MQLSTNINGVKVQNEITQIITQ